MQSPERSPKSRWALWALAVMITLIAARVAAAANTWTATGAMATARAGHTLTVLKNGKVLAAGGSGATAELYDPTTGRWSPTGSMSTARGGHTAALLPDGRVLVAGGDSPGTGSAEIYDPKTGAWCLTASMASPRSGISSSLLSNGKVLVFGQSPTGLNGQIYDPQTGIWGPTGPSLPARFFVMGGATILNDGRVFIGGVDDFNAVPYLPLMRGVTFDPATGAWSLSNYFGSLQGWLRGNTATLLSTGQVLMAGGLVSHDNWQSGTYVFNPVMNQVDSGPGMSVERGDLLAVALRNGKGLVAGGFGLNALNNYIGLSSADVIDPTTGLSTPTGPMTTTRVHATGALLPNGQVLVAGGWDQRLDSVVLASAELYTPIDFQFSGFFPPLHNLPTFNRAEAGDEVGLKFTLSGNQGVLIFASGYPKSVPIDCDTTAILGAGEPAIATGSSLSYKAANDRYQYHWRTDPSWSGTCRQVVMRLTDGSEHSANFRFKKKGGKEHNDRD